MERAAATVITREVAPKPVPSAAERRCERVKRGAIAATIGAPLAVVAALMLATPSETLRAPGLVLFLIGLGLTSGGHYSSSGRS